MTRDEIAKKTCDHIARCAQRQPNRMAFGEAHRRGEKLLAWTGWGILVGSDVLIAANDGAGDHVYPAIKFVSDEPAYIPGISPEQAPMPTTLYTER